MIIVVDDLSNWSMLRMLLTRMKNVVNYLVTLSRGIICHILDVHPSGMLGTETILAGSILKVGTTSIHQERALFWSIVSKPGFDDHERKKRIYLTFLMHKS